MTNISSGFLSNIVITEHGSKKAAEKWQKRCTNKTRVQKADKSYYGFKYKNVWQVILDEAQ